MKHFNRFLTNWRTSPCETQLTETHDNSRYEARQMKAVTLAIHLFLLLLWFHRATGGTIDITLLPIDGSNSLLTQQLQHHAKVGHYAEEVH